MQDREAKALGVEREQEVETKESKIVEVKQVEVIGAFDDNLLTDISCSISAEVLKNPAVLPCDHVFERAAILKAVKMYRRCSLCNDEKKEVTEADVTEAKSMNAKLSSAMVSCLSTPAGCQKLLSDGLDLVKHLTENHLNIVCSEGPYLGLPVIYALTAMPSGRKLLKASPHLVKMMTKESLNAICDRASERGASPAYWLAATLDGRDLLRQYPALLEQITSKTLNAIRESGPERGTSVLYWLAASADGFLMLQKNESLIAKISIPGLNTPRATGPERGKSTLYELARTKEGRLLLRLPNNKLLSKITPEGLNTIASQPGPDQGTSVLYWFLSSVTADGYDFMDNSIAKMVDAHALNSICKGIHGNQSALLWAAKQFASFPSFLKAFGWAEKISQESLNTICEHDGSSVLFYITAYEDNQVLLADYPSLVDKITMSALNAICHAHEWADMSPLYYLAHTAFGRQLLLNNPALLLKVTSIGLSAVTKQPGYRGMSALYFIARDSTYRVKLLRFNHGFLAKKVTPEALNAIVDDPDYPGTSVLAWVIERNEILLEQNYGLLEKISEIGLNAVITGGRWCGESALLSLLMTKRGRDLLLKSPKLIAKINPQGMNAISQEESHLGLSALFKLSGFNETRRLLLKNNRLVKMIQPSALNSLYRNTESPLYWLSNTAQGLEIFSKNPELLDLITEEGLNAVGGNAGRSSLYNFFCGDDGIELFHSNSNLVTKITRVGLNARLETGKNQGDSAIYVLVSSSRGLALLMKHPELCQLIDMITLHTVEKEDQKSAYQVLMESEEGRKVLQLIPGAQPSLDIEVKREVVAEQQSYLSFPPLKDYKYLPQSVSFSDEKMDAKPSALGLFAPEEKKKEGAAFPDDMLGGILEDSDKRLVEMVPRVVSDQVTELDLTYYIISRKGLVAITAMFMGNQSLEKVDLSYAACSSESLLTLVKIASEHKNLESLVFRSNDVNDKTTIKIAKLLAGSKSILSVDLSNNVIGDKGAAALAKLRNIKTFNLSFNPISSKGQKALAKSKTLTTLVLSSVSNEGRTAFSRNHTIELPGFEKLIPRKL